MKFIFKSLIIVMALSVFSIFVQSCMCNCDEQQFSNYTMDGLTTPVIHIDYQDSTYKYDNSNVSDTFYKNEIAINLQFDVSRYATIINCKKSFSLINSAYACKCIQFEMQNNNTINRIEVIALTDFNDSISAGDTMTDAFVMYKQNSNPLSLEKIAVNDALSDLPYLMSEMQYTYNLNLFLIAAVNETKSCKFKIITTLSDTTLEAITDEIVLVE